MGSVVRCTTCRGESQVEMEALGLTVRCPRCDATFIAVEEVETAPPLTRAPRNPTRPGPEPRPERSRRRERGRERDRDRTRSREQGPAPDQQDHDPRRNPSGTLPASVLIGLALLPFAIPILWLIAPAMVGKAPAISIATPSALAISASILCLAVIYTVDWTATTRVKGVLMLVGLAYFSALSLYFVKKELVEKFKRFSGLEQKIEWQEFTTGSYVVKMPKPRRELEELELPIRTVVKPRCYAAGYERLGFGRYVFIVGSVKLADNVDDPRPGTDKWFDDVMREIVSRSGGQQNGATSKVKYGDVVRGREMEIRLSKKTTARVVRVYVIDNSVFYLSVEGFDMNPDDNHAQIFFGSFHVPDPKK